jgi:hypothetical protein
MKNFKHFLCEYADCLAWICSEPTSPDVEYNFYRMNILEKELREYVKQHHEEGKYGE